MRRFAELCQALDASTAADDQVAALLRYFVAAPPADAARALYFLCGGPSRPLACAAVLRTAACRHAALPEWLFDACCQATGDLAETIAHLLPPGSPDGDAGLAEWVERRLPPLRGLGADDQVARIIAAFDALDGPGRHLLVKMISGDLRVGVGKRLVQRALAEASGLDAPLIAQRLAGWTAARATPSAERWRALLAPAAASEEVGQPCPFVRAQALHADPATLGPLADWLVEWTYGGLRAQVVKRAGRVWVWSGDEELVTERFPEVAQQAAAWPDGSVVEGELLVWPDASQTPAPVERLQQRLRRKTLPKTLLAQAPVVLLACDVLEADGADLRSQPQAQRRLRLEAFAGAQGLRLSPRLQAADWAALAALRATARERGAEGLMLKPIDACRGVGRTQADRLWWRWKAEPLSVDAVLVYTQARHGRRAGCSTDYTFAVWSQAPAGPDDVQAVVDAIARREPVPARDSGALQLLPFAKACAGLGEAEFAAVDRVVRATTRQQFGPVRSVQPSLVCEIAFEGVAASPRHKSGVVARLPRIVRIRHDKPLHEAATLQTLLELMQHGARAGASPRPSIERETP